MDPPSCAAFNLWRFQITKKSVLITQFLLEYIFLPNSDWLNRFISIFWHANNTDINKLNFKHESTGTMYLLWNMNGICIFRLTFQMEHNNPIFIVPINYSKLKRTTRYSCNGVCGLVYLVLCDVVQSRLHFYTKYKTIYAYFYCFNTPLLITILLFFFCSFSLESDQLSWWSVIIKRPF